jgi:hypothetical protein
MNETIPPLLAALAECEAVTHQAWTAGLEAGQVKAQRKHLEEALSALERQQRTCTDEHRIGALAADVTRVRDAYATEQARFAALQRLRTEAEHHAMASREGCAALAHQAWTAYQAWQQATRTLQSDVSAYDKYQARAEQGRARQSLEALIGEVETAAVLDFGETRPWLHA